jgi:hypothetical protein
MFCAETEPVWLVKQELRYGVCVHVTSFSHIIFLLVIIHTSHGCAIWFGALYKFS